MPTLVAMLVASLVGWIVEAPVRALLGIVPSMAVSFIVSTFAFFFAKRFVTDLRGGA